MNIFLWTLLFVVVLAIVATVYADDLPLWACVLIGNGGAIAVWLAFMFGVGL